MNEMDHDEMIVTAADFWFARLTGRAQWATASRVLMCAYQGLGVCSGGPVVPAIAVGDRYLETGDRIGETRLEAVPVVLCEVCALSEIPDEAFGLQ